MKRTLCTLLYDKFDSIKQFVIQQFQHYANIHNYKLTILNHIESNLHYPLDKIHIFNLFQQYDEVLFVDADVCFINENINFRHDIDNTLFFANNVKPNNYKEKRVRTFIFGGNKSLLKYQTDWDFINWQYLNYRNEKDDEAYFTNIMHSNNLNSFNYLENGIKCFETRLVERLYFPTNIYTYDIIHFNGFSRCNIVHIIPQLYEMILKHAPIKEINKLVVQEMAKNIKKDK